jgi:hypothetical protein
MNPLGWESSLIQKLRGKVEGNKKRKKEEEEDDDEESAHRKDHNRLGHFNLNLPPEVYR